MRDSVERVMDEKKAKRGNVDDVAQQVVKGLLDCTRQTGQEGDPTLVAFAVSAIVGNVGQLIAKNSLNVARHILRIHLTCLSLLKDALGERQSRVFEIALATEASSALAQVLSPPRAQSPENPAKMTFSKAAGAISALIIGAVLQGLERMVTVFRLKQGLNVIQYVRSARSNSNGSAHSVGDLNLVEVSVHWFRVLVGNCRAVSDGFIVELLGESSIVALSRNQRMLSINLVFTPAFAIFGFLVWKRFILNDNISQLFQSLTVAITDAINHLPFREVCLRECATLYDIVSSDSSDTEFAAMLDLSGPDMHSAFVSLRARIFLNAIIDCQLPDDIDDGNLNEVKLLDKLVHILDTLQPAKFHWQWVELRLLLNEQALIEKVEARDASLVKALSSFSPNIGTCENENNFIQMVLTRLLVRPDAAPLFSEVVHLGSSLEDEVLLQAKWFLRGHDVLFGRKSIRQRLINIARNKGLSTKIQFSKPWGWCSDPKKGKFEMTSVEEGERHSSQVSDVEAFIVSQQHVTEKALVELLVPCIDQSCDESRVTFASDLVIEIEQQISAVTHGEGPVSKGNSRKGIRGGSPGLARQMLLPSPSALRASVSLRLQLLLRLLPVICADGELGTCLLQL